MPQTPLSCRPSSRFTRLRDSETTLPEAEVAEAVGRRPVRWERPAGDGYGTNNSRWVVELEDGETVFVKTALDALAADWLRQEHHVYRSVTGTFIPALRGWHDGRVTLLVIEDLSNAEWPPPWTHERVDAVLAALHDAHSTPPPSGLGRLEDQREELDGWRRVATDPRPMLSTGLCSAAWLERALPQLLAASAACELRGSALMHHDVSSNNICLRDGRALLIDWNWAVIGNPLLDVVAWLPSLRSEGGPDPWSLVPDSGGLAALVAGYFASNAGLPPPTTAPKLREFQRRQGEVALEWAARELELPGLDSGT
jgi:hypothetical protein